MRFQMMIASYDRNVGSPKVKDSFFISKLLFAFRFTAFYKTCYQSAISAIPDHPRQFFIEKTFFP
jgi:hypothetical protein